MTMPSAGPAISSSGWGSVIAATISRASSPAASSSASRSPEPRILFADEPTGNLDGGTGARIVALLDQLNRESGATVVIVTHDLELAQHAQRIIRLQDGLVVEDRPTR
jgi:ABC-type glutathione transport system ATPase component